MKFDYNLEKDELLKEKRGVSFRDAIRAVYEGKTIADLEHHDQKKYPGQRLLIIKIKDYIYVVPYVNDKIRKIKFLKTVYPSRDLTKKYLKK